MAQKNQKTGRDLKSEHSTSSSKQELLQEIQRLTQENERLKKEMEHILHWTPKP